MFGQLLYPKSASSRQALNHLWRIYLGAGFIMTGGIQSSTEKGPRHLGRNTLAVPLPPRHPPAFHGHAYERQQVGFSLDLALNKKAGQKLTPLTCSFCSGGEARSPDLTIMSRAL